MRRQRFAPFAWGVVVYNVAVILWGAYVRATGSGAGCGRHWPLCNGEVLPRSPRVETLIEFTHRATSGLSLILVVLLFLWARRAFPAGSWPRRGAAASLFFILTESLLGAGLVLFELVAYNPSATRAAVASLHLANTLLLLASLTLTAWWGSGAPGIALKGRPAGRLLLLALLGMLLVGGSGAIAALGDTLFRSESLAEGIRQDFSATAHFLIRLRVLHPLLAIAVGLFLILLAGGLRPRLPQGRILGRALVALVGIQLGAGFVNLLLLAPVWMQLVHLLLADLLWIVLVLFGASVLAAEADERVPLRATPSAGRGGEAPSNP